MKNITIINKGRPFDRYRVAGFIRPLICLISLLAFVLAPIGVLASGAIEKEAVTVTVDRTEYEYTPEGIIASFSCVPEKYAEKAAIEFLNISTLEKTGAAYGEKAVLSAGSYIMSVIIEETDDNAGTITQKTINVSPAKVSIVAPYVKSAYTDMNNPPEYYLQPEWASSIVTLEAEYYLIPDLASGENTRVDVPKEIGQYFVKIRPRFDSTDIICGVKQFVYEIAVTGGNRLSDSEAAANVPSWFSANVRSVSATYSGEGVTTEFTVNPALTECELKYRLQSYTDSMNEYTAEPPVEPGDYQAACFASGVMIGDGIISIEKLDCAIVLEDVRMEYDPSGIFPSSGSLTPEKLKVKYVAYTVDDQGTPTMDEVPLPITRCGRFFIVASPEDTQHYRNNTSYAYYVIDKAVPVFDEKTQYIEYDGKEHAVKIDTVPDWIDYSVEYTEIDQKGNVLNRLGETIPVEKGRYMASIIVKANDYVAETTAFIEMKITTGAQRLKAREQDGEKALLGDIDIDSIVFIAIPLFAIIAISVYLFVKSKKA